MDFRTVMVFTGMSIATSRRTKPSALNRFRGSQAGVFEAPTADAMSSRDSVESFRASLRILASIPYKFLLSTQHDVSRINGLPMQLVHRAVSSIASRVKSGNPQ